MLQELQNPYSLQNMHHPYCDCVECMANLRVATAKQELEKRLITRLRRYLDALDRGDEDAEKEPRWLSKRSATITYLQTS